MLEVLIFVIVIFEMNRYLLAMGGLWERRKNENMDFSSLHKESKIRNVLRIRYPSKLLKLRVMFGCSRAYS